MIGALVGAVLQELVEQIAIGTVQFDTVEAGLFGVFRALAIGGDDGRNLAGLEGSRGDIFAQRTEQADMAEWRDGAGGERQLAIQKIRVGNTTDMPELQKNSSATNMDGAGDELPAFYLRVGPDPRSVGVTDTQRVNGSGLAQDQSGAGPLGVVLGVQGIRHAACAGPGAGQRRQNDTVRQQQIADLEGIEKGRHGGSLW